MKNTITKCQCSGCKKFFVGDSAFFAHRTGSFEERTRRCLTTEEMQACGFASEKKFVELFLEGHPFYEEHDVWYSEVARERVRQTFEAIRQRPGPQETK